ncbi:MAG TPA: hypothetical protein VHF89_17040 [Solirubrobacteraceae bacterium]|nr:hypothetical protein [Solirubrobacteraceae bacterium]
MPRRRAVAVSAGGLWRHLVDHAGLQPASWDEDLARGLLAELGEDPNADLEAVLDGAAVSVERFVTALFRVLEPYGQMLGDLLELFAAHNVRQSDEIVEVAFDFDSDRDPLRFDLEAFRVARELLQQVAVWGPPWDRGAWWDLVRALQGDGSAEDAPFEWQDDHVEGRRWPPAGVALARSGDPRVDGWLQRVEVVWRWTRDASAAAAPDLDALRDRWDDDEWTETLASINSDYWLVAVAQGAAALTRSADPAAGAARLEAFFRRHPFRPPSVEQSARVLEDLLALPIFAARHELYGAWVLREIVDAIPADVVLCARDGVLRFPFKPTVMAEASGCEPALAVWSELRSELDDPIGTSRTGAVQPDFSIVGDGDGDLAGASTMEIECKQYRRPKYPEFGAALRDYAKARPRALVVLVDNGPLVESTLLAKVPKELRERTRAIGELHPPRPERRAEFARLVHDRTAHLCPPPGAWLEVRLAWDAPPSDLDLHAYVTEASGARHHIRYNAAGKADRHPYVHLSPDVTTPGGEERLTVERLLAGATYRLSVHAFTTDVPLGGCGARVTLRRGREEHALTCPANGSGRVWDLAEIESSGRLRIIDVVREGEP